MALSSLISQACCRSTLFLNCSRQLSLSSSWASALNHKTRKGDETRLWRSFFYVPGDDARKIAKIAQLCNNRQTSPSTPDLVVLDCEDAVSVANKSKARLSISDALAAPRGGLFRQYRHYMKRNVALRINPPSTDLASDDIDTVFSACIEAAQTNCGEWPGPDYICLPKTESIDELRWIESRILETFKNKPIELPDLAFVGMIESPASLMNLDFLCKSAISSLQIPLVAMVFGSDDYCASLGVTASSSRQETLFPRQYMVTMCKAHGLAAIDMVETNLKDDDFFRDTCALGSQLGYVGKQLIHPKQVAMANSAFSPSSAQVAWARALVEAAASDSSSALSAGAFAFRGHMIDRPTIRQAEHVVKMADMIDAA